MTHSPLRGTSPGALIDRLRHWLDGIGPRSLLLARLLVRLIPARCPFERNVVIAGHRLLHIPPLCRINPLFDQLMALRFRALCRLEAQHHRRPQARRQPT
ncbi:Mo-dependent nitrogenase C-terminal domain-containing protein [Synechococcus sp. CS-1324]|uniref:Mo-dependent nitrogenase C-terminal domain-containing protein n=1 Tax=unclassified Synechococcus TaxID=2626047 RepID=UPI000DB0A00A|nr:MULTISPECIES: Mo-dependent nitrogenase C-terminal domain-containing protein [unclassified Synechococcus]MCT0214185.1 Mo-dependent nitrogenase C-terminal domain-containing protein [Synechococcus sp. CS-1326]MCT0231346.1 Mo-dependent nitrogenase C-terminal domain-containing protein [Synechococcus sp. CS-1324]MCT0232515.1 Mo-dependent nitrogenase C-terminal domain-containing protein [Synechococcus sp. CS-1327]PZV00604.1 MAG: nitrogenase [Cyanobium sp.]